MSRLEWCAVAEPGLMKLPAEPLAAFAQMKKLAGSERFEKDYTAAQRPVPLGRDPGLFALECFESEHPISDVRHRIYSGRNCKRSFGQIGIGGEKNISCGCLICDLARDLDVLTAVAAAEKATK